MKPPEAYTRNIRPLYEHPPVVAEPVAGWKLVPVEPDRAMLSAGAVGSGEDSENVARGAYEAMLAAAPTPPNPPLALRGAFYRMNGDRDGRS